MRLLLDTHLFLWVLAGSPRLKPAARARIEAADEIFVSAASIWEIAMKVRLGKLVADVNAVLPAMAESGFSELPVRAHHAARVASLPAHHDDPFDRLLLAQALSEPLQLLTADRVLARYSDLVVLC
jgi:PIN domain nuclease of toxin-antitoxin system